MSKRENLVRWASSLARTLSLFLAVLLLAAVGLNFVNVLSRYVFSRAIVGAEEIQVFLLVWIAFVGAAVVAWRGDHLRMDVLLHRLPSSWQKRIAGVEAVLVAALSVFMLYQSALFTLQMLRLDRTSDALQLPMTIPHAGVVLGFALLAAVALLRLAGLRPTAPVPLKEE